MAHCSAQLWWLTVLFGGVMVVYLFLGAGTCKKDRQFRSLLPSCNLADCNRIGSDLLGGGYSNIAWTFGKGELLPTWIECDEHLHSLGTLWQ